MSADLKYAESVTPNNTVNFAQTARAIYVGGTGDLRVSMEGADDANTNVTFVAVQAGTKLDMNVVRVWAAGTDATNIIRLW